MKNLVISLASATDRRAHITNEFGKHNVDFEFFDALTPDAAKAYAQRLDIDLHSKLTPTELACMMSHVATWQKMLDENIPYMTIFEDDVYLGEDASQLLNRTDWIQPDWNIIKIEAFSKSAYLSSKSYDVLADKRKIAVLEGKHLGTAGYILSTHGAKLLLDFILNHPPQPLDKLIFNEFVFKHSEPVYQMLPALCEQEKIMIHDKKAHTLPSSLTTERQVRRRSEKKQGLAKLQLEASRLVTQIKKALFAKKITFK